MHSRDPECSQNEYTIWNKANTQKYNIKHTIQSITSILLTIFRCYTKSITYS